MVRITLSPDQARVLGSMVEKQYTTPLNYPMTLNAIKVACGQKSNRDPQIEYSDDQIFDLVQSLEELGYVEIDTTDYSRTTKYCQAFSASLNLDAGQTAILAELFNRGPQTPGELRTRCERMHRFSGLPELEQSLRELAVHGFVRVMERQPGTKEARWAHLFCGEPHWPARDEVEGAPAPFRDPGDLAGRISSLEKLVHDLSERVATLEGRQA